MRAKVVILAGVLGVAVLTPAFYFHLHPGTPAPADQPVVAQNDAAPARGLPPILKRIQTAPPARALERPTDASSSGLGHDDYVAQRKAQLTDLGTRNDPVSLNTILSELGNSDAEVRKAALNAAVGFGSKDAIPALQNQYEWATDPQEKVDIQKAIEFLRLPSLGASN
jgi:hypothetical protein